MTSPTCIGLGRWPSASCATFGCRMSSASRRSRSAPASASPAPGRRDATRRRSFATPTWRCTWPRPTASPGSPCSTRACTPPSARATSLAPSFRRRSTWASSGSSTSRSCPSSRGASRGWKRSCAGSIRLAALSHRASSSRSRRRTARSCPSAGGCCVRPANESWPGRRPDRFHRRCS